jgi:hypothetical protein
VEKIKGRREETQKLIAAAEAYFSEFALFSLPPEIELRARPELYVMVIYIPEHNDFKELRKEVEQLIRGSDNEKDVLFLGWKIRKLFEDYSFNLPLPQARAALKWNDEFVVLEVSQTLKKEGKTGLRIRRQKYLQGLTTAWVREYDPERGLIGSYEREYYIV